MHTQTEIVVNDLMQQGYRYTRSVAMGENFAPTFTPELTPAEMLRLGVFCGKYMTDCKAEFPEDWFVDARLASDRPDCSLNYFGVRASLHPGATLILWAGQMELSGAPYHPACGLTGSPPLSCPQACGPYVAHGVSDRWPVQLYP